MDACASCKTYNCPTCEVFQIKVAPTLVNVGMPSANNMGGGCNCGKK